MNLVRARLIALAAAVAVCALSEALVCQPARANYYAFANASNEPLPDATLILTVNGKSYHIDTGGFQGWFRTGPLFYNPGNTNYMVGEDNGAFYNDYFGFNLSSLGPGAKVSSATLVVDSGLIKETLNYTLYGATKLVSQLEDDRPSVNLYAALKTGRVYDDPILSPSTDPTTPLSFTLNSQALYDINGAIANHTFMFAISGHADLANSVPEPSTWMLMLAGFAGLGVVAHRAARRQATTSAG